MASFFMNTAWLVALKRTNSGPSLRTSLHYDAYIEPSWEAASHNSAQSTHAGTTHRHTEGTTQARLVLPSDLSVLELALMMLISKVTNLRASAVESMQRNPSPTKDFPSAKRKKTLYGRVHCTQNQRPAANLTCLQYDPSTQLC